jgi:hypothetical protein
LLVTTAATLPALYLPNFRYEGARQSFVSIELVIYEACKVTYRERTAFKSLSHQRPQSEATGVVFHPSCLEGGILTVIAEH